MAVAPKVASAPQTTTSTGSGGEPVAAPVVEVVRRQVGNRITEDVPETPAELADQIQRYQNARSARLAGFVPDGRGLFIKTRFGETTQLHQIDRAMGARDQRTFFDEPVGAVAVSRRPQRPGVVFTMDAGGNEYSQLFWFDETTGEAQLLTDGVSRNSYPTYSDDGRFVCYSSTERNGKDFDLWQIDTETKKRSIIFEGEGLWVGLDWSRAGDRILALRYISATRTELAVIEPNKGVVYRFGADDDQAVAYDAAVFNRNGEGVYYVSDEGRAFKALRYRNVTTGRDHIVSDPNLKWDVTGLSIDTKRSMIAIAINEGGFNQVALYDLRARRWRPQPRIPNGVVRDLKMSPDGRRFAYTLTNPATTGDVYVHSVSRNRSTRWTRSELGGVDASKLEDFELFEFPTFDTADDGQPRVIPAMILRPPGAGPFPVVIDIHGGPEGQARPDFSSRTALLAGELGAAVIRPNVRGSTGYGRDFTLLDNGMKREDAVKDIGALLDWVGKQPDLDAGRIALLGGSYGGYMVLASAAKYSARLKAVVDVVGISNFVTFLESTKAYRRDLRRAEYGDERDPEMRAFLEAISPLNHAEQIRVPLFVIQGQNDPRVPATESVQIVERLRQQGQSVWYMLATDEGHGFKKKGNRDALMAATYLFLKAYL